jgi:integrase/recombinase XerD
MNPLPLQDQENIRWFIKSLHLCHARSPIIYACILRDFQRFVIKQSASEPPSVEIVKSWLEERILRWPLHIIFYRARLVDRFLDWMKAGHRLASNPLQELRSEYGQRTTTPIIRALLSSDSATALEQLRPLPLFGSFLGSKMREHVTLMRSMGHRYDVYANRLRRFDKFLQGRPDLVAESLPVLIAAVVLLSKRDFSPFMMRLFA